MDLIDEFRVEHLRGDMARLSDFCVSDLINIPHVYGFEKYAGDMTHFDCDDCALMRRIYERVWGLSAPDFRGDTMNSFRTMFGRRFLSRSAPSASDEVAKSGYSIYAPETQCRNETL